MRALILILATLAIILAGCATETGSSPGAEATAPTPAPTAATSEGASQAPASDAASLPPATATPGTAFKTFGEGDLVVGTDVAPGTYRTREAADGCYWARLKGFTGDLGDIITNENTAGPAVVTIAKTDKGFSSTRCATWTNDLSQITTSKTTLEGNGTFIVGTDLTPGTWSTAGGDGCYWARLRNFGGELDGVIVNGNVSGRTIVTIKASDKGFKTERCQAWTKK